MRLLRFFCNLIMFIAITIGVSVIQVGLYDITAIQSSDIEEIHLSAAEDNDISYFDNFTFWAEDIKTNIEQSEKYRIRNWASWAWWKKGMGWADKGLDTVIAVFKPVFVPIAQVNAVMIYHEQDINDFSDELLLIYKGADKLESQEKLNNALYEVFVIFGKGYGEAYTIGETKLPIAEYEYTGSYKDIQIEDLEVEYARWVKRNGSLYNTIWKLSKYNSECYSKYFKKFIRYDEIKYEDGSVEYVNRHIKTPVTILYYQQFVALLIAFVFVLKYPIALGQGRFVGRKKNDLTSE